MTEVLPSPEPATTPAAVESTDEIRETFRPPKNTLFLHARQMEVFRAPQRFKVVVAGRRWGKCLHSGSLVEMANGSHKPIERIVPGDHVLTINEDSYRAQPRKVLAVECNGTRETVVVRSAQRSLRATPHHPILTHRGWVNAGELKRGERIAVAKHLHHPCDEADSEFVWPGCDALADGDVVWEEVVAVKPADPATTWDLSVEGNHNFIANGIVVHNTQLAKVSLIKFARRKKRLVWYVAPSYRMAKQIMWPELVESIPRSWVRKYNETVLTITLVNGTRIELKGANNPDSLRGVGIHYLVMDEYQDIDPDAWVKVLRPTLASTGGHALFIGTPKSFNALYQLWEIGQRDEAKAWASWQFPTITSPFIPREEIEAAKRDMDEKSFK